MIRMRRRRIHRLPRRIHHLKCEVTGCDDYFVTVVQRGPNIRLTCARCTEELIANHGFHQ